jgi:CBS domain-containing protein
MRARDLASSEYPTVGMETSVMAAARLLAGENLPGLVVLDDQRRPVTVLPGTQVLRLAVPRYCQDDPALARVVDEPHADALLRGLADRTVRQALPEQPRELPIVAPDALVLEVAALMARARSPLVAVVDDAGVLTGVITLDALLDRMLAS